MNNAQLIKIGQGIAGQQVDGRQITNNNTRNVAADEWHLMIGRKAVQLVAEIVLAPTQDTWGVTTSDTKGLINCTNTEWPKLMKFVNSFMANRLKTFLDVAKEKDPAVEAARSLFKRLGSNYVSDIDIPDHHIEALVAAVRAADKK